MAVAPAANAAVEMMTLAEVSGNTWTSAKEKKKPSAPTTTVGRSIPCGRLRPCRRFQELKRGSARLCPTCIVKGRSDSALERRRRATETAKPGDRRPSIFHQVFFFLLRRSSSALFRSPFALSHQPRLSSLPTPFFLLKPNTRASPSSSPSAGPPPAPCSPSPSRSSSGAARASR